jgi:polar amino acid transport system substrate-binding protein
MQTDPVTGLALAPTGPLRVAVNLGNGLLAKRTSTSSTPEGVSVDLARHLASQLGLAVEYLCFDGAANAVAALKNGHADLGFFAIDPERGAGLHYTPPYITIEGCYLVAANSPLLTMQEVDRASHQVVVGAGSAYDLFLKKHLQQARILRVATSQQVVDQMLALQADVAAGVRQQLESDAKRLGGLRLLEGNFMLIQQAMAIPDNRGQLVSDYLDRFILAMKSSGFLSRSLLQHQISGVSIPPPLL